MNRRINALFNPITPPFPIIIVFSNLRENIRRLKLKIAAHGIEVIRPLF